MLQNLKTCLSVISIILLVWGLSGCGFHLQGKTHLAPPFKRIYLQTNNPYGYLARYLRESLKLSNVELASSPCDATIILIIQRDENLQQLITVNSTTQTRQYNLQVLVAFALLDKHGYVLLPTQQLSESRVMTIQSNQILGSSNESNLYFQQMRRTLANAIMNRIGSREVSNLVMKETYPSRH